MDDYNIDYGGSYIGYVWTSLGDKSIAFKLTDSPAINMFQGVSKELLKDLRML